MSEPAFRPTPLEVATHIPVGEDEDAGALPDVDPRLTPLEALEQAILPALGHPPCVVAFSGGRDSSTILAVASRAARREGLPLPIPVTACFPDAPDTDETRWQEMVVRMLRLPDWHRRVFTDELDLLGPLAQSVLRRHGLMWPAGAYFHYALMEDARGGTLLTGIDGDTVFGEWRWARAAAVLNRRVRPQKRDALRIAFALAPHSVRMRRLRRREPLDLPWLRPGARAEIENLWAAERAAEPRTWSARVGWYARRRYLAATRATWSVLAADAGARALHPFLDGRFLAALARAGGRAGFPDRTTAMRALFSGTLPDVLLARSTKALFDAVFWGPRCQAFVESWTGEGIPHDLVDEAALRQNWRSESPDARTDLLLHAAWLASAGREAAEQLNGAGERSGTSRPA